MKMSRKLPNKTTAPGNSVLAEKMLSDKEFPEDLCFENLDISEYIIEKMQERLDAILAKMDTLKPTKKYAFQIEYSGQRQS
jgi:hypothetical protein